MLRPRAGRRSGTPAAHPPAPERQHDESKAGEMERREKDGERGGACQSPGGHPPSRVHEPWGVYGSGMHLEQRGDDEERQQLVALQDVLVPQLHTTRPQAST